MLLFHQLVDVFFQFFVSVAYLVVFEGLMPMVFLDLFCLKSELFELRLCCASLLDQYFQLIQVLCIRFSPFQPAQLLKAVIQCINPPRLIKRCLLSLLKFSLKSPFALRHRIPELLYLPLLDSKLLVMLLHLLHAMCIRRRHLLELVLPLHILIPHGHKSTLLHLNMSGQGEDLVLEGFQLVKDKLDF